MAAKFSLTTCEGSVEIVPFITKILRIAAGWVMGSVELESHSQVGQAEGHF